MGVISTLSLQVGQMFLEGESIEYAGKAVVALAGDKRVRLHLLI